MADSPREAASDMLSSSAESSSSCASSEASDSPTRSPARSPHDGGGSSGPRVPPLSLRVNLAALPRDGPVCDAPMTSRQHPVREPTSITHADQRAAGPQTDQQPRVTSRVPAMPQLTLPARPAQQQVETIQATKAELEVSILSHAFNMPPGQLAGGHSLASTCVGKLGIPLQQLKCYALTEVSLQQPLPDGCSTVAVQVEGSRFSLASLEELVDENLRLQQQAEQARQQPKEELAVVRRLEAEVARLRAEKDALQQRVERSEALRRKGARALTELQQEFAALSHELKGSQVIGVSKLQLPEPMQAPQQASPAAVGTPVALQDGLLQDGA